MTYKLLILCLAAITRLFQLNNTNFILKQINSHQNKKNVKLNVKDVLHSTRTRYSYDHACSFTPLDGNAESLEQELG